MPPELRDAEEEAERRASGAVMNVMRANDAAQALRAEEKANRKTTVDEAIVDEEIPDREDRHAKAHTKRDVFADRMTGRAPQDERDRDRCVNEREKIIPFEATLLRLVMRAMNAPERAMPEAAVEKACPQLHSEGNDDRERQPEAHR